MSALRTALGVFAITFIAGNIVLAAEDSLTSSKESVLSFLVPEDKVETLKQEAVMKPVQRDIVNAKIGRIANKVQQLNPSLLTFASAKYKDTNLLIENALVLSLVAKSPIFNSLGLSMEIASDRYFALLRDRISLVGTIDISGYDILKTASRGMAQSMLEVESQKYSSANQYLREKSSEGEKDCQAFQHFPLYKRRDRGMRPTGTASANPADTDSTALLVQAGSCAFNHHLYESSNFSDFLERISPLVSKVRIMTGRDLQKRYGLFTVLTGYGLDVCTKNDYTCRGEYLYLKGSVGIIASAVSGAAKIEANRVKLEISAYSFRSLNELFVGDGKSADIDLAKYFVLKQIENMDDAMIDAVAEQISGIIVDTENNVKKFNESAQRQP